MIKVELVYINLAQHILHMTLELQPGARVIDALNAAEIYHTYPETKEMPVGIYAKLVALDTLLKEGDRVEIYRALIVDPKEKRRQRARLHQ